MIDTLQHLVRVADSTLARAYLSCFRERAAVRCFLFHSLFRHLGEIDHGVIDPLERTTVEQFRLFIEYYLTCGYTFVTPRQLAAGLAPGRQYAMITFDDGYYSSGHALPVMKALNVPATFFIATEHVRTGRSYWWDVLHRERFRRGATAREIRREVVSLKDHTAEQIETYLTREFGAAAFDAKGDIDRPFTPDELRAFAKEPLVEIGNHTTHHSILTNYPPDGAREQIVGAQRWLTETLGQAPISIAYPNGAVNPTVAQIAREAGLSVGFTTRPHKNAHQNGDGHHADPMQLGRFCLHGEAPVLEQCKTCRSDLLLYPRMRQMFVTLRPGGGRA